MKQRCTSDCTEGRNRTEMGDTDSGILRWPEWSGGKRTAKSDQREQPRLVQAHQAHTVTRQSRTWRQTVLHAAGRAVGR